jgi:large subunit ribosomal protein L24
MSAPRKFAIKRDDVVIAIRGEDAAGGKTGKVLRVLRSEGRAVVEGFNLVKRHTRKTQANPEGGIIEKEAPIAISNLRVYSEEKEKAAKKQAAKKA